MSDIQYKKSYNAGPDYGTIEGGGYDIPSDTYAMFDRAFRAWEKRRGINTAPKVKLRGIALRAVERAQKAKDIQKKNSAKKSKKVLTKKRPSAKKKK